MDAIVEGPNYEFATETHEVKGFAHGICTSSDNFG